MNRDELKCEEFVNRELYSSIFVNNEEEKVHTCSPGESSHRNEQEVIE